MKNGKTKINRGVENPQQLKKTAEDYKNKYLRALADYQNFENRTRQQRDEQTISVKKRLLTEMLPFLDNLEKAEVFLKDDGLKIIKKQFYQTLENEGLKEADLLGQEFDPHLAEAIEVVEGEEANKIVEVLRKGYMLGDEVLRVAQVKVSKKI